MKVAILKVIFRFLFYLALLLSIISNLYLFGFIATGWAEPSWNTAIVLTISAFSGALNLYIFVKLVKRSTVNNELAVVAALLNAALICIIAWRIIVVIQST